MSAYGYIEHPFGGQVNSPFFVSLLSLSVVNIFYFFSGKLNWFNCIVFGVLASCCLVCALYLGGRLFFVVVVPIVLWIIGRNFLMSVSISRLGKVLALFACLGFFLAIVFDFRAVQFSTNFVIERFFTEGIDSPRFELFIDGFVKSIEHPFGGFTADPYIYGLPGFQNLFIDISSIAGIVPAILSLLFFLIGYPCLRGNFNRYLYCLAIMAIFCADTFVASNYYMVSVFFFLGMVGLSEKSGKFR